MRAKYQGDPADNFSGPRVLRAFDRTFPKGRFVSLTGADAEAVFKKLSANSHFETGEGEGEADQTPLEPEITEAEVAQASAPVSDDGAAESPEKADLIARLQALKDKHPDAEIAFDGRWGAPKLQAALEAALFELGED